MIARLRLRRHASNNSKSPAHHHTINDEASVTSESSDLKECESATTSVSKWLQSLRMIANHPSSTKGMTNGMTTPSSKLHPDGTTVASGGKRLLPKTREPSEPYGMITPKISPSNPLHSQRGTVHRKFSFDDLEIVVSDTVPTPETTIVRTQSWEQSIQRWTTVILATNEEAPDQSEVLV